MIDEGKSGLGRSIRGKGGNVPAETPEDPAESGTFTIASSVPRWARERSGHSLEEMQAGYAKYPAREEGGSCPACPRVEKLARLFKVPVIAFFFPEPPDRPPVGKSFRTISDARFNRIPGEIPFPTRKARAFQIRLSELNEGRNRAERLPLNDSKPTPTTSIANSAREIRNRPGIDPEQQEGWSDETEAFDAWREAIESGGVAVFEDASGNPAYSGFRLHDDMLPVIHISNSVKTRQILTLIHELAHLLLHTSGIDATDHGSDPSMPKDVRKMEIPCDRFATGFPMPDSQFETDVRGKPHTGETAEHMAKLYKVSGETVYRRFHDKGQIDSDEYGSAAAMWKGQEGKDGEAIPTGRRHHIPEPDMSILHFHDTIGGKSRSRISTRR